LSVLLRCRAHYYLFGIVECHYIILQYSLFICVYHRVYITNSMPSIIHSIHLYPFLIILKYK
jgi:hypothetical protein